MKLSNLLPAPKGARDAARFVETYLIDMSAREFFAQPSMAKVVEQAKSGDWSSASKEFRAQTGSDIQMSVFAAEVAAKV